MVFLKRAECTAQVSKITNEIVIAPLQMLQTPPTTPARYRQTMSLQSCPHNAPTHTPWVLSFFSTVIVLACCVAVTEMSRLSQFFLSREPSISTSQCELFSYHDARHLPNAQHFGYAEQATQGRSHHTRSFKSTTNIINNGAEDVINLIFCGEDTSKMTTKVLL